MADARAGDRRLVDDALAGFLDERLAGIHDAEPLYDEIRRFVAAGGKRLRPAFCLTGFVAATDAATGDVVPAAAALELLHVFALMHDDVMDRSALRRGVPAAHVALAQLDGVRTDRAWFGQSAAILAGDLAMTLADILWEQAMAAFPMTRAEATGHYHVMREEVVAGQFLDVHAAATGNASQALTRRISILKSGRYTVERPLLIGASLGGATPAVLDALRAYGSPVGEAFQLRDDVLGVFGDPARTGKDTLSDLREGKRTLLVAEAIARAGDADRRLLEASIGDPRLDAGTADRVREIIEATGALARVRERIDELLALGLDALRAEIPERARARLESLARDAAIREG